jgi:hypothetical protein
MSGFGFNQAFDRDWLLLVTVVILQANAGIVFQLIQGHVFQNLPLWNANEVSLQVPKV